MVRHSIYQREVFKAFILFIFRFVIRFKLIVVGLSTSYSILAFWSSRSCEGISEGHTQYHFFLSFEHLKSRVIKLNHFDHMIILPK